MSMLEEGAVVVREAISGVGEVMEGTSVGRVAVAVAVQGRVDVAGHVGGGADVAAL